MNESLTMLELQAIKYERMAKNAPWFSSARRAAKIAAKKTREAIVVLKSLI